MADSHRGLQLLMAMGATFALITGCTGPATTEDEDRTSSPAQSECNVSGPLDFLCGPQNAEDIVRVGSTPWLIASNLSDDNDPAAGRIYLIDSEKKTYDEFFPGESPVLTNDATMYPNCPSVDLDHMEVHGLAIREIGPKTFRLYATTHGSVEAIQAWEIEVTGDKPSATWVGCVPLPDAVYANAVAILADGGFMTTKYFDPTKADPYGAIQRGEITGEVYEWHPGGAVTAVPATEMSGANGIEISADERYLFVAAYGGHEIVRFDLGLEPGPNVSIPVEIAPDNLRWTADGTLLTVGVNLNQGTGWTVIEIDPSDMIAIEVTEYGRDARLQNASTALEVDDEVWIGTWSGDGVGYYSAQ